MSYENRTTSRQLSAFAGCLQVFGFQVTGTEREKAAGTLMRVDSEFNWKRPPRE